MTEKFIQGSAPFFLGQELTTGTQILEKVRDELALIGWTITDEIALNDYFLAQGKYEVYDEDDVLIQTDNCWVKFTDDTAGNIIINGDSEGNGLYLSSDVSLAYSQTNNFRLFGGFNDGAGGITIYNNIDVIPTINGGHFGFLSDRAELLDDASIYIGDLRYDSWLRIEAALDYHSKMIRWKAIANDFYNSSIWENSTIVNYPMTIMDYLTTPVPYNSLSSSSLNRNMSYFAQYGKSNAITQRPVPCPYLLPEGLGADNVYPPGSPLEGKNVGTDVYIRGIIQFVKAGCRKELTGTRIVDKKNEELILSHEVGGLGLLIGRLKRVRANLDVPTFIKSGLSDVLSVYDSSINYVLGTDYTIDLPNSSVTFLGTGNIVANSVIFISYAL